MNNSSNDLSKNDLRQRENEAKQVLLDERDPFNDAIKHGDIVQGFQSPKQITQLPKWYRKPRRIFASISVLVIIGLLIYQIIQFILNFVDQ
ncbi:hypothetical protein QFZ87_004703 [Bacillus sp. SLBN-46]|uniref:hypothetical protein n=1 Tax=Bacillus sp. SLBN-46 TaxID=3042283 RepID=UPI00285B3274|nr:hypothetical protein [Bacillus sp. SLBN-46]MDR6125106.1 hypothetical protein [Bacillus sp. SLBN-46]